MVSSTLGAMPQSDDSVDYISRLIIKLMNVVVSLSPPYACCWSSVQTYNFLLCSAIAAFSLFLRQCFYPCLLEHLKMLAIVAWLAHILSTPPTSLRPPSTWGSTVGERAEAVSVLQWQRNGIRATGTAHLSASTEDYHTAPTTVHRAPLRVLLLLFLLLPHKMPFFSFLFPLLLCN